MDLTTPLLFEQVLSSFGSIALTLPLFLLVCQVSRRIRLCRRYLHSAFALRKEKAIVCFNVSRSAHLVFNVSLFLSAIPWSSLLSLCSILESLPCRCRLDSPASLLLRTGLSRMLHVLGFEVAVHCRAFNRSEVLRSSSFSFLPASQYPSAVFVYPLPSGT